MDANGGLGARPPRLAEAALQALLPRAYRDAVIGDLTEEFLERIGAGRSRTSTRLWYWSQLLQRDVWRLRAEARRERDYATGWEGVTMDGMLMEVRQAVRVFRTAPGFAAAAVVTLATGIGGTTAVFSLVNALLLRPLPGVIEPARVAVIQANNSGGAFGVASYMDYLDFAARSRSFEALAAYKPRRVDVSAGGTPEALDAAMVSSSYFAVAGISPHVGRFFGPEVDAGPGEHPQAVLTEGLWRRWFAGDPAAVGKDIVLNGRPYTVVGVTPPGFRGTQIVDVPQLFVPMTMQPHLMPSTGSLLENRGWSGIVIVGRLGAGASMGMARSEVETIGARIAEENPHLAGDRAYRIVGLREASIPGAERADLVRMSALLLAVVGALWLVVCLNVANLFFARSLERRAELGVRRALGAGRVRVAGSLVLELVGIATVAGLTGGLLAQWIASAIATLPIPVLLDTSFDGRTAVFVGGLAFSSALVCSLIPALVMSGAEPTIAVSSGRGSDRGRHRLPSRALIVGQVTLSVVLLFGTSLFVRTFTALTSSDPGFDARNLLTAEFDPGLQGYADERIADFYGELAGRVGALPGVVAVALTEALPSASNFGQDGWIIADSDDSGRRSSFGRNIVSANFFDVMGIPVVAGRGFTDADRPGRLPALVVNEAAARLIQERTSRGAVGARLSLQGPEGPFFDVVGVVGDSRTGRETTSGPVIYAAHRQVLALGAGGGRMVLLARTALPAESLAGEVRRVAAEVDRNVSAFNVLTMDAYLGRLLAADRLIVTVLGASSALALLLVAIGVYGLLTYLVTQRTREFGIRIALGAGAPMLRGIVVREAMVLTLVGLGLGSGAAIGLTRFAESFLVGVSATDPLALITGVATVAAAALAAAYVPARRATLADPLTAIRVE